MCACVRACVVYVSALRVCVHALVGACVRVRPTSWVLDAQRAVIGGVDQVALCGRQLGVGGRQSVAVTPQHHDVPLTHQILRRDAQAGHRTYNRHVAVSSTCHSLKILAYVVLFVWAVYERHLGTTLAPRRADCSASSSQLRNYTRLVKNVMFANLSILFRTV